jgi:ankyrin repeat protein
MSQADIDAFVFSAAWGPLTSEGVTTAMVTKGIPVNGLHSYYGSTALHKAVWMKRRELVVALLAAGADANVKSNRGVTSVRLCAAHDSTARILQLLIDGGGSVNEPDNFGQTPLIALVSWNNGDAAARLGVLLARPELNLDVTYKGKTAEQWAEAKGHLDLAQAIAAERSRRQRWNGLRSAWVAAASSRHTCVSYDS